LNAVLIIEFTLERGRRQECRAAFPASENLGVRGTVTRRGLAGWWGTSNFGAGLAWKWYSFPSLLIGATF